FSVVGIRGAGRVPTVSGPPVRAARGGRLVVAEVLVTAVEHPASPFCVRGYGALLVDARGRRFMTVAREKSVRADGGPDTPRRRVCDEISPGVSAFELLVFEVPAAGTVAGIAVWDRAEEADRLGRTYLYFRAGG